MSSPQKAAIVTKPLAAYRLGLLSRTAELGRDLFLAWPDLELGTADGVHFAYEKLNEGLVALANEIDQNVYSELRQILGEREQQWAAVSSMVGQVFDDLRPWDAQLVDKSRDESYSELRAFADQALEHSGFKPWYDLGAAVGAYFLSLSNRVDDQPMPNLDKVVERAGALPATDRKPIPVLESMVGHASDLPSLKARAFLEKTVASPAVLATLTSYGSDSDAVVVLTLLHKLDDAVQDGLASITQPAHAQSTGTATAASPPAVLPKWDKPSGELRLGSTIIRKVAARADKAIKVLDAFEAQAWPSRIANPLHIPSPNISQQNRIIYDSELLHNTIRSLNTGLTEIKFHGDGGGEGIQWTRL
jgi:hypothetical protein